MRKINRRVVAIIVACAVCVSGGLVFNSKYQNQKVEIESLRENIIQLQETVNTQAMEVETLKTARETILADNEKLQSDLDLARQRIGEATAEIDRLEEIKRVERMSRGVLSSEDFTTESDVTVIRIDNGDLLDAGLQGNLKGLGWAFVNAGKQYGIDPLFLAAISAQESGWGKYDHGNNNIFGISSGAKYFSSYEDCIYYSAKLLANYYVAEGRTTPALIQPKYCPSPTDWHYAISAVANTILNRIVRQ